MADSSPRTPNGKELARLYDEGYDGLAGDPSIDEESRHRHALKYVVTMLSSRYENHPASFLLPDCMLPDGAEPCAAYRQLEGALRGVGERLAQSETGPTWNGDMHAYLKAKLRPDDKRLPPVMESCGGAGRNAKLGFGTQFPVAAPDTTDKPGDTSFEAVKYVSGLAPAHRIVFEGASLDKNITAYSLAQVIAAFLEGAKFTSSATRESLFMTAVCEALFGCFLTPAEEGRFRCADCDWPIAITDWVHAEHDGGCIIPRVRNYLTKHKPECVPARSDRTGTPE